MPGPEIDRPKASEATSGMRCASSITSMSFAKSTPLSSFPAPIPADRSENNRLWLSTTMSAEDMPRRAFW